MSKTRNLSDLLDSNGDVKVGALDNAPNPVAVQATTPSSASEGDLWYDSSTGNKKLKYYDGTAWLKVSPVLPTVSSISGSIIETIGGNITITGTGFLSGSCTVKFEASGVTTASVSATASSDTTLTVAVPSAFYNAPRDVEITVTNSDNAQSQATTFAVIGLPSGGTISTSGSYRIHTFTSSTNFVNTIDNLAIEYVLVAGGGGGGSGGGGGAGGYRSNVSGESSGGGASAEAALSIPAATYSITIGSGGAGHPNSCRGGYGANTSISGSGSFGGVTAAGGGGGGGDCGGGLSGGSGGGGGTLASGGTSGGSGTSGQGYAGGSSPDMNRGGGGGGAAAVGNPGSNTYSNGGTGVVSYITGTGVRRSGGGGGSNRSSWGGSPGSGGGGGGGNGGLGTSGYSGTVNTGGGGGAGPGHPTYRGAGNGGSGVVIIRYQV